MRRQATIAAVVLGFLVVAGFTSNAISAGSIDRRIRHEISDEVASVQRIWPSASRGETTWLSRAELRDQDAPEGLMPIGTPRKPWAFSVNESLFPFVSRVNYGWAAGGQLGAGREKMFFTFFGLSRCFRSRNLWFF
jgi:hypothetical protein